MAMADQNCQMSM